MPRFILLIDAPATIGCDLELAEPCSAAFVREWLAPPEQRLLAPLDDRGRARTANLLWTAKVAAAGAGWP